MNDRTESMRQLIEMSVQSGKKRQHAQTGYVHHCYHPQDEEAHVTIPIAENFFFALALLRSRTIENINEAKTLLDRLLYFQNRVTEDEGFGNFPIYIHEYPYCKDRFTCVDIAMAVYWIINLFHQVLGGDLKNRLEESFKLMIAHGLKACAEKPSSYPTALKIAALCQAGGKLLQHDVLQREGAKMFTHLQTRVDSSSWYSPSAIGSMLSALTMAYPNLSDSPWSLFWKHVENTWHEGTCCYVGPAVKEMQDGYEPQATLYDLFMAYFTGTFSARIQKDAVVHLQGALIPVYDTPFNSMLHVRRFDQSSSNEVWHKYHGHNMAYCSIEKYPEVNQSVIKNFHPFRVVWGDKNRVHSFVCQGGNSKNIEFLHHPDGMDILFDLNATVEAEDREKNREIIFFMDIHDGLDMTIAGHKATTFALGDEILMRSGSCQFSLVFHLQEGEGTFLGHRMLGNRPSQIRLKGKQHYDAYDWQLFLRTIKRTEHCVIKASLRMIEGE